MPWHEGKPMQDWTTHNSRNDDIRVCIGRREFGKYGVQIAEDVELHRNR